MKAQVAGWDATAWSMGQCERLCGRIQGCRGAHISRKVEPHEGYVRALAWHPGEG